MWECERSKKLLHDHTLLTLSYVSLKDEAYSYKKTKDNVYVKVLTTSSYLVMVLDAHTDGVNKDSDHNAPAEVLALHNAPKFPPHIIPNVLTKPKACPFLFPLSISPLL